MQRILQVAVANDKGGLTGYIVNNYRRIDKSKFQFDFITYDDTLDFANEVESMGAKIFYLPRPSHPFAYYNTLKSLQQRYGYMIIHFNLSYANFIPILLAKLAGFKRIIVHSHSTGFDEHSVIARMVKQMIHRIGRYFMPRLATDYWACSKLAANWMFPASIMKNQQYHVMYNAIDLLKFRFDKQKRMEVRKDLGISDNTFVIGHVGRFTYQKNHEFLIDVFREVHKKQQDSVLLLIGDGPDRAKIKDKVVAYGLQDNVRFLGQCNNVASMYQAMDVMVIPSHFEGLCIVAIEAQMAGLPCICSEALPEETNVSSDYIALSLKSSPQVWADAILKKQNITRKDQTELLRQAGYDANYEIKKVEKFYQNMSVNHK